MMLCVIGDVDAERVAELAKQYTPAGAQERAVRDYGAAEDMACRETSVKKKMEVSMPTFAIGFKCPPAEDGTEAERMDIIGDLAAELLVGESSALYQRLYEQGVIDADFSCNFEHMKGLALLVASGDSETPELVLDELLAEAERVAREGVDRAQFERLKKVHARAAHTRPRQLRGRLLRHVQLRLRGCGVSGLSGAVPCGHAGGCGTFRAGKRQKRAGGALGH